MRNPHAQVVIGEVDCTEHRPLCKENQIKGLPTIKSFVVGGEIAEYAGKRILSNLDTYVQQHLVGSTQPPGQGKAESVGEVAASASSSETTAANVPGTSKKLNDNTCQ